MTQLDLRPQSTSTPPMPQYSRAKILGLWLAAAAPMGLLAWVVAPAIADPATERNHFTVSLIACLTAGLIWQFALVAIIVRRERGSLRWAQVKDALWLHAPSDGTRHGGRLWWWALAVALGVGVLEALPIDPSPPGIRDFGLLLGSDAGQHLFHGNLPLLALALTMFVFNTVLGEELLFRGLLLPRMRGAFGRYDRLVNGILFGAYHFHQPWSIPSGVTTGVLMAYASRRWRSAWMGILAHSAQSVVFSVL